MMLASALSAVSVVLSVGVHLLAIVLLLRVVLKRVQSWRALKLAGMVLLLIIAHLVEIMIFAGAIWILFQLESLTLEPGEPGPGYLSAVAFTSLGSDVLPQPTLRLVVAIEALTGLILITWSASFLFLVMQRGWGPHTSDQ